MHHLRIPGPTPIPPRVQQAMNQPMIGHRSKECSALIHDLSKRLQLIFGTKQNPLILSGSGTSALEAAVTNTLSSTDEALVVVTGAFGDRFAKIIGKYGFPLHRIDVEWGQSCDPDQLRKALEQHPHVKAVFFTYCETSTGVLNPIQELAQTVHAHSDALVIVDGVSCLGAVPCEMDAWGIDIMITGSQKALMLPPGLAFVAISDRAWQAIEQNPTPRFYLDLIAYRDKLAQDTTPFTPAVSLLFGLSESLLLIEEEGLEQTIQRHELLKEMTRAAIRALGLELMTTDADASPTVTSIYGGGEKWSSEQLRQELAKIQVIVAGGQQHLKGKIFRIGHMGYCEPLDICTVISALEYALIKIKLPIEPGQGIKAAQEVWNRV